VGPLILTLDTHTHTFKHLHTPEALPVVAGQDADFVAFFVVLQANGAHPLCLTYTQRHTHTHDHKQVRKGALPLVDTNAAAQD
jgi:hypothetical protein